MHVQITHVIVHSDEQVETILATAARLAEPYRDDPALHTAAFTKACDLLGARFSLANANAPAPLPPMAIPRNMRH